MRKIDITYCEKGWNSSILPGINPNPPVPAQPKVARRLKKNFSFSYPGIGLSNIIMMT